MGLRDYLNTLRRHLWIVLSFAAVGVAFAAYQVQKERPLYRANALVRFTDERRSLTGGIEGAAVEQIRGPGADPILSQIQVLRSRTVLGRVVDLAGLRVRTASDGVSRRQLRDIQVAADATADSVLVSFGETQFTASADGQERQAAYGQPVAISGVAFSVRSRPEAERAVLYVVSREEAILGLLEQFAARPQERTDAIYLEYTDPDPYLAEQVVNTTAETFQAVNAQAAQQEARRRRTFVEEQLRQNDSVLTELQVALGAFRSREQLYSSRETFGAQQAALMSLDVRREELDADRRVYQSLLTEVARPRRGVAPGGELRALAASPGIASNPVIGQLYSQLVQFESARDSLTTGKWRSAAGSPDVQRLDSLIATTEAKVLAAVRSQVDALSARIAALDQLRSRNAAELRNLPTTEVEEARLAQQVQTLGKVGDQLREELQKARIAEAVEAGQVEIIDRAILPSVSVGTGRVRKVVFGLLLGLMLGGGTALLLDNLNTSITRREEVEQVLRVPGLATIPQLGSRTNHTRLARVVAIGTGKEPARAHQTELVTISDFRSAGAEAFRTLRTNLIFSQVTDTLRSVVVTSSLPGEGKTTTAANLAVAYAQQGLQVLLIDCDLRRPRLHKVFELPASPGVTELALGHTALGEAVRRTSVEGLFLLPSGTLPPNPSELLGGARMRNTLQGLSQRFDLLILDSPPLHAAADAAIVGREVDGVLLVVRAGQTERGAAQQAVQQLVTVGARIVGAVLNDADAKVPQYGGYYYNDYYGDEAPGPLA